MTRINISCKVINEFKYLWPVGLKIQGLFHKMSFKKISLFKKLLIFGNMVG